MTMLVKLENYYRESGILSTDFNCKHLKQCIKCQGCCRPLNLTEETATDLSQIRNTFTGAKSAYIGKHYGDSISRLLFVSLDPGAAIYERSNGNVSFVPAISRTPAGVQERETTTDEDLKKSPHWKYTHMLANQILNLGLHSSELKNATPYFAHVNAAKCTVNSAGKAQAPGQLFKNCKEYLSGEIKILAPDIIITQGKWAKEGVEHAFSISSEWAREQVVTLDSGKKAEWFPSYHPSNFGKYKEQEKQLNQFVKTMRTRVNSGK